MMWSGRLIFQLVFAFFLTDFNLPSPTPTPTITGRQVPGAEERKAPGKKRQNTKHLQPFRTASAAQELFKSLQTVLLSDELQRCLFSP